MDHPSDDGRAGGDRAGRLWLERPDPCRRSRQVGGRRGDPGGRSRRSLLRRADRAHRNCAFEHRGPDLALAVDDPDVDAVLVSGPTASHAATIEATIAAGKAVMSEKPLAPSFATVESLVDLVVQSGVVGQVGFQSRFNPMFTELKRLVDEETFGVPLGYMLREDQFWPTGSVVAGHSSWRSDPASAGGGALLEHTIHGCDLLAWLFGPAATVSARTRAVFGFGVEDIATAQVTHDNEVVGTVTPCSTESREGRSGGSRCSSSRPPSRSPATSSSGRTGLLRHPPPRGRPRASRPRSAPA